MLHRIGVETLGIEDDRDRVAQERPLGEDIDDLEFPAPRLHC